MLGMALPYARPLCIEDAAVLTQSKQASPDADSCLFREHETIHLGPVLHQRVAVRGENS